MTAVNPSASCLPPPMTLMLPSIHKLLPPLPRNHPPVCRTDPHALPSPTLCPCQDIDVKKQYHAQGISEEDSHKPEALSVYTTDPAFPIWRKRLGIILSKYMIRGDGAMATHEACAKVKGEVGEGGRGRFLGRWGRGGKGPCTRNRQQRQQQTLPAFLLLQSNAAQLPLSSSGYCCHYCLSQRPQLVALVAITAAPLPVALAGPVAPHLCLNSNPLSGFKST